MSLVTMSTAKSLLNIVECKMIEEIMAHVDDKANGDDQIVLKQLNYLRLHQLPSLTSFCSGNYAIDFPSLEQVFVQKCLKMLMFSQRVPRTPKLHKVHLREDDDNDQRQRLGSLNTTRQRLFNEMTELM